MLKEFVCLENLQSLAISSQSLTSQSLAAFAGRRFPKLRELHLGGSCDGSGLAVFADAPLKNLSLTSLSDAGAALTSKFHQLENLNINQPKISGGGLRSLVALPNVAWLNLSHNSAISDAEFASLRDMRGLRNLVLIGSEAGDAMAEAMADRPLRWLQLGSPNLTDRGMKAIGRMTALSEMLEIGARAKISDAGLRELWGPNRLRTLNLRPTRGITGVGFSSLTHELEELRVLRIASLDLSDEGLLYLGYMPMLEEVEIGDHQAGFPQGVTDVGLLALAEAPRLRLLRLRKADNRKVTAAGIDAMRAKIANLQVVDW